MLDRSTKPLFCLAVSVVCLLVVSPTRLRAQAVEKANWFSLPTVVYSVAPSPDGKLIAYVGSGKGIRLIDTSSGKEVARLGTFSTCHCVRFTPDSKSVFHWAGRRLTQGLGSGDWEAYVDVFDIKSKKLRKRVTLPGFHGANNTIVALDNKTLLASGTKEVAAFFDIDTGKKKGTIAGDHRPSRLAVSQDGRWLLTADYNRKTEVAKVCLWDIKKRKLVHDLYDHTSKVLGLAFSPDGKWCASTTDDGRLWVFDREKGKEKGRAPTLLAPTPYRELVFTPDGKTLIAAGSAPRGGLVFWDWQKSKDIRGGLYPHGKTVLTLKDGTEGQSSAVGAFIAPDGKRLYVAAAKPKDRLPPKCWAVIDIWDLTKPFNFHPPKPKEPSPEPSP